MDGVCLRESVLSDFSARTVSLQEDTCLKEKAAVVLVELTSSHQNMYLSWEKFPIRQDNEV